MARGRGKLTPQDLDAMTLLAGNLQKLLAKHNKRQVDIVRQTGIPASTLTGYIKGSSLPVPENVQKLADFFQVTMGDIDPRYQTNPRTKEEKELTEKITKAMSQLAPSRQKEVLSYTELQLEEQGDPVDDKPLYKYKVYEKLSAGTGFSYFNDGNYDPVFHDEYMEHDFASWVFGDSMEPTYLNGEVVLVKQSGFDYDGAIYAVDWDGQTYIKKVYREEEGLRLVSINKKYADKFAPYEEEPRIIGQIIGNFMPMEY